MARWMHVLAAAFVALLLIWAPAPSAVAQPAPGAKISGSAFPKLEPVNMSPVLTFCDAPDKAATIADIEADIAKVEANIKALNDYFDAVDIADGRTPRPDTRYSVDLSEQQSDLGQLKDMLARAKARKVVDCKTLRSVLPPDPIAEHVEWAPRSGICDPKAAAEYIAELDAAYDKALRNVIAVDRYRAELKALQSAAAKGPPFAAFKEGIDTAVTNGARAHAEAVADFQAVAKERARAMKEEPIKCPEPRAAPKPAGPGGVDDGPKASPAPPDGPSSPPKPKPFPRPYIPPATPKPPGDGPKATPGPAPGPGAFHIPWSPQRPRYQDIKVPGIPVFCDEPARNAYLSDVLTPAIEAANSNVVLSDNYLTWLGEQFARGSTEGWPTLDLITIQDEIKAVNAIVKEQQAFAAALQARFQAALKQPLSPDCPKPRAAPLPRLPLPPPPRPPPPGDEPKAPPKEAPKAPAAPGGKVSYTPGCDCDDGKPIAVGPNNRVGSSARTRDKAVSTALGLVGGLIGGGHGGGGGGGGSDGPQLVACRIGDKEMTVFDDPETGTSLKVGARRTGDKVTVYADVAKSPDDGTFQAAWLRDDDGARAAPGAVGICDLWGEWQLTVSWTKTTYVNDQVVSREEGGWSKSGSFHIPGTLSSAAAPDGLWRRLGFSNASHGARKVALTYDAPKARLARGPLDVVIHVTRPGRDPVTTVPFVLRMSEGPKGFVFEKAPPCTCGSGTKASFSDVPVGETVVDPVDYRTGDEDKARRKTPGLPKPPPAKPDATPKSVSPPDPPKTTEKAPPSRPATVDKTPEGPLETDAELDARRTRNDASQDKRFEQSAPRREAYHARLDEIAKRTGPGPGRSDSIKDSIDLDDDGVPTSAKLAYFRSDFPLPIYTTTVDGEGHVTGGGFTDAYRAYMTMKAAVQGGRMEGPITYGSGPDGQYVEKATVKDQDGHVRGQFTFGPDGNVVTGETFDPEGHRVGVINGP